MNRFNQPRLQNRFNGLLWVRGYGQRSVLVERVNHGISIINDAVVTRSFRSANFKIVTSGSFTLDITMMSYEEYDDIGSWLMGYGQKMAAAGADVAPMRVTVPKFGFDKTAIPTGTVTRGDSTANVVYRMSLAFVGASDPVGEKVASKFSMPAKADEATPHFYPGNQLKGEELTEEMYDEIEADKAFSLMKQMENEAGSKHRVGPAKPTF